MPFGMKKVFQTLLTETSTKDKEVVGTLRFEGNKIYKWIKFNNGQNDVACVAGNVGYYYGVGTNASTGGYENNVVTMDQADMYLGAGVFQAIIADGLYGWIQIKGPATITTALKAGGDGEALTHVGISTDGTLDVNAADTSAMVAFATDADEELIACDFPF